MAANVAMPNPPSNEQIDNIILITIQNFCNSYSRLEGAKVSEIMSWLNLIQKDRNNHCTNTPTGLTDQDWDMAVADIAESLTKNNIPLMHVFSDIVISNSIHRLHNQQKIRKANRQQKPNKIRWKTTEADGDSIPPATKRSSAKQQKEKLVNIVTNPETEKDWKAMQETIGPRRWLDYIFTRFCAVVKNRKNKSASLREILVAIKEVPLANLDDLLEYAVRDALQKLSTGKRRKLNLRDSNKDNQTWQLR